MTSTAINTAIGSVAVASLLLAFMLQKKKITVNEIVEDLFKTPYFHSTKKLGIKDEVIIGMLESCQDKGPCYVITDPSLEGIAWELISCIFLLNLLHGEDEKNHLIMFLSPVDNPIIYASEGFTKYTGYRKEEIEGRNCRFLQGKDTDPADVKKIREGINKKEPVSVCLLNYRKDGSSFLNQVRY